MATAQTLDNFCADAVLRGVAIPEVATVILAIARSAVDLAKLISLGALYEAPKSVLGVNADGDLQKDLDLRGHALLVEALRNSGVAYVASEESEDIEILNPTGALAVAIDPLDGSANIDANISIGTIFSLLPSEPVGSSKLGPFGGYGSNQLAAGFFVYGPQTVLVLTLGRGVDVFTLDPLQGCFKLTRPQVRIPVGSHEYAINASNYRHWEAPVRIYIDDCLNGEDGLRGANFNMRWIASLVAEAFRILIRGGIFLYPSDARPGYQNGRIRLLYEAAPIAFIVEQAGGRASTGRTRILDMAPTSLHQRVPLIFGSPDKVERLDRLHGDPQLDADRAPLFGQRGLFRT